MRRLVRWIDEQLYAAAVEGDLLDRAPRLSDRDERPARVCSLVFHIDLSVGLARIPARLGGFQHLPSANLDRGYGMLLNANNGQIKRNVIRVARRTI